MKRVVRSRSGREIYGPKWQNMESSNEDNALHSASTQIAQVTTAPPLPVTITNALTPQGMSGRRIHVSNSHESMYRATLEGDCVAVEMLLEGDPKLASDEISEEGDRALHVAAAIKHKEIVRKLVEKMSEEELALLDGNGYTACCYAAISGAIDIADLMLRKDESLGTARDRENKTPLYKAAFRGRARTVSFFLKRAKVKDLPIEEWFDLLFITIRREMYGVAFEILEKDGSLEQLATMKNDEGTALHLLAKQHLYVISEWTNTRVIRKDMWLLAEKLWERIQRLGQATAVELMKNPPILHFAAQVGNVELITMITHTYPHLVWHTNTQGYTIFHIAVMHRQWDLFSLIDETGARKDLIAVSQDKDGNNILHLAAKASPEEWRYQLHPTFQLKAEILWYKAVRAIAPPFCEEMTNQEGHTPVKLFFKERKSLVEKCTTWTRNSADSSMLISTLIMSVVFTAALAVPGGYNQETGVPTLFKSDWFTCFVVFEALAMFFSAFSILHFSVTMMSSEEDFFERQPFWIQQGLACLSLSVFGAISVFMSAYFMIYVKEREWLIKSVIIVVYIVLFSLLFLQNVFFHLGLSGWYWYRKRSGGHSLFRRDADTNRRRRCWDFLKV